MNSTVPCCEKNGNGDSTGPRERGGGVSHRPAASWGRMSAWYLGHDLLNGPSKLPSRCCLCSLLTAPTHNQVVYMQCKRPIGLTNRLTLQNNDHLPPLYSVRYFLSERFSRYSFTALQCSGCSGCRQVRSCLMAVTKVRHPVLLLPCVASGGLPAGCKASSCCNFQLLAPAAVFR